MFVPIRLRASAAPIRNVTAETQYQVIAPRLAAERWRELIAVDKKSAGTRVRFVLLREHASRALLAGLFLGIAVMVVVVTGLSLGFSLLVLALAGLPILGLTLRAATLYATSERARLGLMLGVRIPAWPAEARAGYRWGIVPRWRMLTERATWGELGYGLLRLPFSAVAVTLTCHVGWPTTPCGTRWPPER